MASVPQTVADLGSGPGARAWILSSMSVGLAAGLLASGALGDAWGRRRVYVAGIALLGRDRWAQQWRRRARSSWEHAWLEGLGGAAVLACGLAILAHAFTEPAARAHATGDLGCKRRPGDHRRGAAAAGLDFGTGWRETYVVVGAVALGLLCPSMRWLPESTAAHPRRLDLPGVLTLAAALTLLVSGLTQARSGFSTGRVAAGTRPLLLVAFVLVERHTDRAHARPGTAALTGVPGCHRRRARFGIGIIGMSSNVPSLVQVGLGDSLWVATWLVARLVRDQRAHLVAAAPVQGPALGAEPDRGRAAGRRGRAAARPRDRRRLVPLAPASVHLVAGLATGVLNAVLGREAVANVPADRAAMGSGSTTPCATSARRAGSPCSRWLSATPAAVSVPPSWSTDGRSAVLVAGAVSLVGGLVMLPLTIGAVGRRGDSHLGADASAALGGNTQ